MLNLLISAISTLFLSSEIGMTMSKQEKLIADVKRSVRVEVFAILFRLLIGVILTAIAIYTLFYFAQSVQTIFGQMLNPLPVEIGIYGLVSVAAILGLYFLFKTEPAPEPAVHEKQHAILPEIDWRALAENFVQGAADGLASHQRKADEVPPAVYTRQEIEKPVYSDLEH